MGMQDKSSWPSPAPSAPASLVPLSVSPKLAARFDPVHLHETGCAHLDGM